MVRTQLQLTEKQAEKLRRIAKRSRVSQAEVMRRLLDRETEAGIMPDREELKRRALEAIGSVHSDVTDLSVRHDDYFAEAAEQ